MEMTTRSICGVNSVYRCLHVRSSPSLPSPPSHGSTRNPWTLIFRQSPPSSPRAFLSPQSQSPSAPSGRHRSRKKGSSSRRPAQFAERPTARAAIWTRNRSFANDPATQSSNAKGGLVERQLFAVLLGCLFHRLFFSRLFFSRLLFHRLDDRLRGCRLFGKAGHFLRW